ncbi:helix-turn-helix transcriptional regulator [Acinetobacter baumannii]|nr:helix-turn-helix transcriptional regulator [Acinetobacter baumannii]MDC5258947.1 helix-turn-helix transcriptional regulator [Acinetobacter baumannii]MDC5385894.1 helix-turn-helix transcriptional regulator [Acinetobacter baumannii]RZH02681.1 XRE family transcriptional regulator [Acinetobacter pittii]
MDICQKFGFKVRQNREKLKWSQEQLADHCGLHRTYISGIERGKRNPTLQIIDILARSLQVHPADLLKD